MIRLGGFSMNLSWVYTGKSLGTSHLPFLFSTLQITSTYAGFYIEKYVPALKPFKKILDTVNNIVLLNIGEAIR